jgi:chaperone BCS1
MTILVDGVGSAEGKIIIITTNNATKLDPALLRPGRIDKRFKIDFADKNEIEEMFLKYFPGKTKKAGLFRDSIMGNNVSTAEIQQHLIKYHHSAELACKNRYEVVDNAQSKEAKSDKSQETAMHSYISLW